MAQLARKCPDTVSRDLQIIVAYFNHLIQAPTELHDSIREALISIAPAFRWNPNSDSDNVNEFTPNSNLKLLLALLTEHAESKLTIVQNVVCVFLTTCFPDHYVPARYLLLLIAGESSSLRETITQYLYGVSKKDHINYSYVSSIDSKDHVPKEKVQVNHLSTEQRRIVLPGFKPMIKYIHEMSSKRSQKYTYGRVIVPFTYEAYTEILEYLRLCLWFSAGANDLSDEQREAPKLNAYIRDNYEPNDDNEIQKYLLLMKPMLIAKRGSTELICLYDLLNSELEELSKQCYDLLESFGFALKDVSERTRVLVSRIVGILWAIGTPINDFNAHVRPFFFSIIFIHTYDVSVLDPRNPNIIAANAHRTCPWRHSNL